MNRYLYITLCLLAFCGSTQSAKSFTISGPGGNQILAEPGSFYKGETPKPKYNFKDGDEKTDEIGNPITEPPPDPHRFDINMTKPITTQADVNEQAEKSCVVLGMSGSKHNNESLVRAKCHTLNMRPVAELPKLHPLLDHSKDTDDDVVGKNYTPHVSMGKLHFSVTHEDVSSKPKSPRNVNDNIFKRHDDISEENLMASDQLKSADRSCDLTSDLRVMLSPRCLNSSEARARERIGGGDYHSINKEDLKKAVEIQKKNTSVETENKYLCHIIFNPAVKHGFVQGYLKSKEDCISAGMMMSGAVKEEIFDKMGYLLEKHYNRR